MYPKLLFHIDQPASWPLLPRALLIRGWAFWSDGAPVYGLRLALTDRLLTATLGFVRPDVPAALPTAPNDRTGVEIRGLLPAGRCVFHLEAQRPDGRWLRCFSGICNIPARVRPAWLPGGDDGELLAFQLPGHAMYAPRPLQREKFPRQPSSSADGPALAIVTPSFQQGRFLAETLASVLAAAGDVACQYVVQDGGSTDGSIAAIRREASRLHAWSSEPDAGQADAILRGFAKTSGKPDDIMAWLNSDDSYLPGALSFVRAYFARHPEVDAIYGHRILVDENSREIGRWFLPRHEAEVLRLNDFVPQETLFWRRRLWDAVGGLDTSFQFAMDWDLLLRFQAAGARIVRVPYFLGCFRIHPAQKTSAQLHELGQREIDRLRERTFGRPVSPTEIARNPTLLSYLRRSAFIQSLWRLGLRAP